MDDKYGNIYLDNQIIDINKIPINELGDYLQILEAKERQLLNQQNEYLSYLLE